MIQIVGHHSFGTISAVNDAGPAFWKRGNWRPLDPWLALFSIEARQTASTHQIGSLSGFCTAFFALETFATIVTDATEMIEATEVVESQVTVLNPMTSS